MLWLIIGLAAVLLCLYLYLIAPGMHARKRGAAIPRVPYAHRGLYGGCAPENSLSAFHRAAEKGYGIELDVHLTRDGKLAVIHDASLLRMCGKEGDVSRMTSGEIRAYRLSGTQEPVPFLEEALKAVAEYRPPLIVELKSDGESWKTLPRRVLDAMKDYPGFWCAESFDPRMLRELRKQEPRLVRGQLAYDPRKIG
ncbi:MAG: glycerophosphodiester phosphodiesterase, partial [Deltaproteobacteria bacterium]|nr:glycerophosphodiester phosphodiesterase [Deltaproteobacteria bacterium]